MASDDKINILIVDDRPSKVLALQSALADLQQNVVTASSGQEALRHLLNLDFAVILMDVNMPVMDGFEAAALIRARPRSAHTPIIFVTAVGTTEKERARGYSLGAVDYLFTPVPSEIIRAKVAAFVDLFQMSMTIKRQADELAALNDNLNGQLKKVERLNRELGIINTELEAFSYSVSHDLRAPLRAIDGFSQALLEDYQEKLDEAGKKHLHRIRAAAGRMGQLIDDLLLLSRVTRSDMRKQKVNLSELVNKIASNLHNLHPDRQVELAIVPGLLTQADTSLLMIVMENLIGNAWKFTSKKATAKIEFGRTPAEDGRLVYFIRDDGAGFDPAFADKLFKPFQRLHSMEDFPGTGIGLATVQRIIHRHGGRIWAEGNTDQGATFYFTLETEGEDTAPHKRGPNGQ